MGYENMTDYLSRMVAQVFFSSMATVTDDLLGLMLAYFEPTSSSITLQPNDDDGDHDEFTLHVVPRDGSPPLHIRLTIEMLEEFRRRLGGSGPDNSVKDRIRDYLVREYPILGKLHPHVNIVGDPQAGKSRCIMMCHVHELTPVLVLMNQTASYNQIILRDVVHFNRMLCEMFHCPPDLLLTVHGLRERRNSTRAQPRDIRLCMGTYCCQYIPVFIDNNGSTDKCHVIKKKRMDESLRPGDVCRILSIHPRTLFEWTHRGKIAFIQTKGGQYRYPKKDIIAPTENRSQTIFFWMR